MDFGGIAISGFTLVLIHSSLPLGLIFKTESSTIRSVETLIPVVSRSIKAIGRLRFRFKGQAFIIIGIRSISRSSDSLSDITGRKSPALVGSASSIITSCDPMLDRISTRKTDLKPISISSPSYWHLILSYADIEKSISCAETKTWLPLS